MGTPELPKGYEPFETFMFSSNTLENVRVPLLFRNQPVLLVGAGGKYPRVWLSAPGPVSAAPWLNLVEDNEVRTQIVPSASVAPVRVELSNDPVPTVEVWIGYLPLLRARKEDRLVGRLDFVDLRPIGLNIVGSTDGLMIGTNRFSHSTVKNAEVMVSAG